MPQFGVKTQVNKLKKYCGQKKHYRELQGDIINAGQFKQHLQYLPFK